MSAREVAGRLRQCGTEMGIIANKSGFEPAERGRAAGRLAIAILDAANALDAQAQAIQAAESLARREALEAAAKVVETHPGVPIQYNEATTEWRQASKFDMAHAIRNLKAKE